MIAEHWEQVCWLRAHPTFTETAAIRRGHAPGLHGGAFHVGKASGLSERALRAPSFVPSEFGRRGGGCVSVRRLPPVAAGARLSAAGDSGRWLLHQLFGANQDFAGLLWQPFRDGVEIHRIYGDGSGAAAALLRYAPGASVPQHEHVGFEHIVVLAGSQCDQQGAYAAGSCLVHAPGTRHAVVSHEGCVVLAIWSGPVVFLDDEGARPEARSSRE